MSVKRVGTSIIRHTHFWIGVDICGVRFHAALLYRDIDRLEYVYARIQVSIGHVKLRAEITEDYRRSY